MFGGKWKARFSFLADTRRRGRGRPAATPFRPGMEQLEDRRVPANLGSIAGHVFIDPTGNGAAPDNPPKGGVTLNLYQDTNNSGVKDTGDVKLTSQLSAADGSYSFGNLAPGRYFVTESVPSGWVRTVPALSSAYTVDLADGQASTGNDFDNFQKLNTGAVTGISFDVTHDGVTKTVTNLRGQTQQGDTVTANFTVADGTTAVVTLVAYDAPGPTFDANTASQQVPVQIVGGTTFAPGPHSLTVVLPPNYFQVDFVCGATITQLGPAGSNIFYSAQGRLLSADNGGTNAVPQGSISGHVLTDTDFSGTFDSNNTGLAGATVTLTGTDSTGHAVSMTTTTDANGNYNFAGLSAGTYMVQVTTPVGYTDEAASGVPGSNATAGTISDIVLTTGASAVNNDFLELLPRA
jgi:uncharacterized surface anchored protein